MLKLVLKRLCRKQILPMQKGVNKRTLSAFSINLTNSYILTNRHLFVLYKGTTAAGIPLNDEKFGMLYGNHIYSS